MNPIDQQLQAEASRRFQGQAPSNAGTAPNPSTSTNPLSMRQNGAMPEQGNMMAGATGAVQGAQPGEANILVKGLLKRLHMLNP